jgi:hypothetical protein
MEDKIEGFLRLCSEIDFGTVRLSDGEKDFCRELNNEVVLLCNSLPKSTQTDALLLLMQYFQIPIGAELTFFSNYYAPSWSIIYWIVRSMPESKVLEAKDISNAKRAHGMALLLHPLDDHLNDNELPITHLTMLLRSQSWLIMNEALSRLADEVDDGIEIVRLLIDDYYSGVGGSKKIQSLDGYCERFKKQMATGFIVPGLIMKKMNVNQEFSHAVLAAYASFGIAWRLLDDINDIEADMMKGNHSAIYHSLPEDLRNQWAKDVEYQNEGWAENIFDYIIKHRVIEKIKERICAELDSAAAIADDCNLTGLADELRSLLNPLKENGPKPL